METSSRLPGATQNISVPYESPFGSIMVSTGQEVTRGDLLLEIEPSPKAHLNFIQANNLYESAKLRLKHVKQLFELKLATNTQILQAKQTLEQAKSNLQSLKQRGAGGKQNIHSDVGGLIKKVYIQEGSIAPAGAPLVEIIAQNRLEARLGIEPENIDKVQPRQPVLLSRVNVSAAGAVTGTRPRNFTCRQRFHPSGRCLCYIAGGRGILIGRIRFGQNNPRAPFKG